MFVPPYNYEEAMEQKNDIEAYDMDVIAVRTLDEAIEYFRDR